MITVEPAVFATNTPQIVAPNDSKPQNWNQVSRFSRFGDKIHFFTDLEDESLVDIDGTVLHPKKVESEYNAMYESLDSITIYDGEYNEIETLEITES